MNQLTEQQIIDEALRLYSLSLLEDRRISCVIAGMWALGLRAEEAINRSLWSVNMSNQWVLITCKGSETRTFDESDMPPTFISYLRSEPGYSWSYTYSTIESWLISVTRFKNIRTEKKGIACHIFRYAFILRLKAAGLSAEQIRAKIGHRAVSTTMNYMSPELYEY